VAGAQRGCVHFHLVTEAARRRLFVTFAATDGVEERPEPGLGCEDVVENSAAALETILLLAVEAAKRVAGLDLFVAAGRREREQQRYYENYEPAPHEAALFSIGPATSPS